MRKTTGLAAFILLLCFGWTSAVWADEESAPAPAVTPVTSGAGQSAIEFNAFAQAQEKNHCSVSYTACSSGGTISCSGHTSCTSGSGWVECDGTRTYCPSNNSCTAECPNNPDFGQCTSQSGDCDSGWSYENNEFYFSCDGRYYSCASCPNGQIIC